MSVRQCVAEIVLLKCWLDSLLKMLVRQCAAEILVRQCAAEMSVRQCAAGMLEV